MRILTRSTVFETVVMRSLFWCVLALAVAFSSVPAQAQGFEDLPGSNIVPAITADQVGTSKEHLKEFVEAAVDAYYIEFLIRRHCDFWEPVTPEDRELITSFLLTNFPQYDISDLTPESIKTLSTEQIKKLIPILTNLLIARDPECKPLGGLRRCQNLGIPSDPEVRKTGPGGKIPYTFSFWMTMRSCIWMGLTKALRGWSLTLWIKAEDESKMKLSKRCAIPAEMVSSSTAGMIPLWKMTISIRTGILPLRKAPSAILGKLATLWIPSGTWGCCRSPVFQDISSVPVFIRRMGTRFRGAG